MGSDPLVAKGNPLLLVGSPQSAVGRALDGPFDQPIEESGYLLKARRGSERQHPAGFRPVDPVFRLMEGTSGNKEQPALVSDAPTPRGLGDVGSDRVDRSDQLVAEGDPCSKRPVGDRLVDLVRELDRQTVGPQLMKITGHD